MSTSLLLATKIYIPPPRPNVVHRFRLIERLNEGLQRTSSVTLISAPAGFGKTTLVCEWIATLTPGPSPIGRGEAVRTAWLSLDEGDNDPVRFLLYVIAAVQMIVPKCGESVLSMLPTTPPTDVVLTTLLNELAAIPDRFIFVLDDYHTLDCKPIDDTLTFLIDHLPPHMQLVVTTREDLQLPLARLRARGQLTELRAGDLRFTPDDHDAQHHRAESAQRPVAEQRRLDTDARPAVRQSRDRRGLSLFNAAWIGPSEDAVTAGRMSTARR